MSARFSDVGSNDQSFSSPNRDVEMKRLFRNTVTPHDRHVVSQFLLDAETEIKECQNEIGRLMSRIHSLENKQTGLKKTIQKCRSLLSPVHRLPTETLTRIFSFVCEWNELLPKSRTPAQRLSMVCGRWREVVLSSPSLWASVRLPFRSWRGKMAQLNVLASLFMTRSRHFRLNLELVFCPFDEEDGPSPAIDTLSAHSDRWKSLILHIDMSFAQPQYLLPNIHDKTLPLLEYLQIRGTGRFNPETTSVPATLPGLFRLSPALRSIALGPGRFIRPSLALPWKRIDTVEISSSGVSTHRVFNFLALFSTLRRLDLPCLVSTTNMATKRMADSIDSMTTVEHLACQFGAQEDVEAAFKPLTLPALQSLEMSGKDSTGSFKNGEAWWETPCLDCLDRSGCSITFLSLKWLPMTDKHALSLLRCIPTLSALRIEEAPGESPNMIVTSLFLQDLTVVHERFPNGWLAPLLTEIALIVRADAFNGQDVFRMVSSLMIQSGST